MCCVSRAIGKRPRVLVITPSKELALQVEDVCKTLGRLFHVTSTCITGRSGKRQTRRVRRLRDGADILICTPGSALDLIERKDLFLSHVSHVVLDEADTLLGFGSGFQPVIHEIFKPLLRRRAAMRPPVTQFVFVAASINDQVRGLIQNEFPNVSSISSSYLHHLLPRMKESFIYVGGNDKLSLLTAILQAGPGKVQLHSVFSVWNWFQMCVVCRLRK